MSNNTSKGSVTPWQAFVRTQAILALPRHPHWDQQAWMEYAHLISCGVRDMFTLSERDRERAENLFFNTIIRLQAVEHETQIGLN